MDFSPFPPRPRDQSGLGSWGRNGVGYNKGFFVFYAQFVRTNAKSFPPKARVKFMINEKDRVIGFQFASPEDDKRATYTIAPSKSRLPLSTRTVNAPRLTRVLRDFGYPERATIVPKLVKGIWILPKTAS